jgi:hypothetical protein
MLASVVRTIPDKVILYNSHDANLENTQSLEFVNEAPSINEDLSGYLQTKLKNLESQERTITKQQANFEKTPKGKKQKKRKQKKQEQQSTKSENRRRTVYALNLFDIGFYGKVKPARQTIANMCGFHVNTFDNHKKELKKIGLLGWDSGKKTYETNTYYLPDHVRNQAITRPKDFVIPRFLFIAIQYVLKKLDWKGQQAIYQQLIKDVVHHISLRDRKERTSSDENSEKCAKDPPKTRGSPKRPIFRRLLSEFKFNFKDQAILSSHGEGPLRAAICDLNSYNGKVKNAVAFLISRCRAHQRKIQDQQAIQIETPEQNIEWLKQLLMDQKMKARLILQSVSSIDRSTQENKPFVNLLIHKKDLSKSKLIIEQKVHGTWINKAISVGREKFRETILSSLEMAFKYSEGYQARVCC